MGVHAAKRLPDFSYIGEYEYSLTCCTFNRHCWFTTSPSVEPVCAQMLQTAKEKSFEVPAYCFMPDHVHVLVTGTSADSNLPEFMAAWKQKTGYAHKQSTGLRLWQGGYFDHVLRGEEDRAKVIRYLLENPIRAGLERDLRKYPFWGSGLCSREALIDTLYDEATRVRGG